MKALVVNALGRGFDFEDVDIAAPIGREVLVDVQAAGLCHTDLLFATNGLSVSQLRLVLDFIHEHLDLSVSVFQLARLVDLSSSQFARMFKASTGVSPHRYQLNTRIGKAQELLLMKGESLSMVAVATGFADQSHFTRTFKRVTGATPHEWHQNRTP